MPANAACAATAKIRPESSARRLPLADSTSRRLAQPRVMIMPAPNSRPPNSAPDRLPRAAIWRVADGSSMCGSTSNCTATTAVENASNQTDSFSPNWPRQNSMTAARRQKRERWAKKPNRPPMTRPPAISTRASPKRSSIPVRSMRASRPLILYINTNEY